MIPLVRGSPDCEAQLAASLVELAQRFLSEAQSTIGRTRPWRTPSGSWQSIGGVKG